MNCSVFACALHGRKLGGESPLQAWQTVSGRQGGYREVVAEGSWTQTPELTNRN
ncbi:hypothetical protein [Virgibacillus pantothenticus]|uniref:hypothetical protein n=1 Tax=Virgibacillus pantothenticus TaxID=1473 RepID=UPI0012FEE378|nr:hypothetical protein [Virgibacillus pantothenticus]